MPRIHFAVLAHANEPCVADLVRCLWDLNPGARVSLFNGGKNPAFFTGQGVDICPRSMPLRYGNLTGFHYGVMRWLTEINEDYDFLVTLDHDMLPMRAGLGDYLASRMADVGYMGARFRRADDPDGWELGGPTVAQINQTWSRRWQPLFETPTPYWAFNPGQVFTRGLVDRILGHRRIDPLMALATRSRIWAMEEVVYPTLAVAAGAETRGWVGEHALLFDSHSPERLAELAADPEVYFVHRIGMQLTAPDRQAVHDHLKSLPAAVVAPSTPGITVPPSRLHHLKGRAIGAARQRFHTWHIKHRA